MPEKLQRDAGERLAAAVLDAEVVPEGDRRVVDVLAFQNPIHTFDLVHRGLQKCFKLTHEA
jgi:hypothetical protein